MNKMQRQGDVLFVPIKQIPEGAVKQVNQTVIVEGEMTGHAHRLRNLQNAALYLMGMQLYMRVQQDVASVDHEDHGTNIFSPGDYEIRRQTEINPWGKRVQVLD
jgi:hypothetical protein